MQNNTKRRQIMVKTARKPTNLDDEPLDLRKRPDRDLAEKLVELARWTLPEDRALIEAVYRDGISAARLASLNGRSPRAVRQRIHTIVTRILSDRFMFVLRQRDNWPTRRRRVADLCVLRGMSMRQASESLGYTLHTVRRQLDVINALFSAENTEITR